MEAELNERRRGNSATEMNDEGHPILCTMGGMLYVMVPTVIKIEEGQTDAKEGSHNRIN